MVYIGRSKFGHNNRISLTEGLPEIMELQMGDYVEFHVENGKLILRKEVKKYDGFDFESEAITKRLQQIEEDHVEDSKYDDLDPEAREERARQQYLADKAERERRRKEKD